MGWAESSRRARDRHWARLERLLNGLPAALGASFRLLQYDLALRYSDTGRFRDIFTGVDQPPVLSIASWLFDDLGLRSADRDEIEGRAFLASVLLAAREHLVMELQDTQSFAAGEQLALAVHLSERVAAEATALSGGDAWLDHAFDGALHQLPAAADSPEANLVPRWERPMQLLGSLACTVSGLGAAPPGLDRMIGLMAAAFEIRVQLATMHADLLRGRPTYPIALVARAARIPLRPWPRPEAVLGAMVITGSVPTILDAMRTRLDEARTVAQQLRLQTFADFVGDAVADVADRMPGSGTTTRVAVTNAQPLIRRAEPTVPKAIAMARGHLLSDLTFRESWDLHREGMFGADEVASRFPAGLVLEILAAHGHQVAGAIEDLLDWIVRNGFRYYEHPLSAVDTDTVGVFLRLLPYTRQSEQHRAAGDGVLALLERHVERSRVVPVWLRGHEETASAPVVDLGEGCGTVAAHLLLGLCVLDDRRYDPTFEVGARSLLSRIREVRLAANVNYPPAFALAAFTRLAGLAADRSGLVEEAEATRSALRSELDRLCRFPARTAQDAALMTIACLDARRPDLLDTGWHETILKHQRFDGSWSPEPFAAAPNRGDAVTWYASATMTTALAYDALARWEDH